MWYCNLTWQRNQAAIDKSYFENQLNTTFRTDTVVWLWLSKRLTLLCQYATNWNCLLSTFSDFEDILWSGLRTLSEQRPIVDDYSTFK